MSIDKKTKCYHLVLRIREIPGSNPVGYPGRTIHDFPQGLQSDLHRRSTLNQAMIAPFNILSHSLFTYLKPEMNPSRFQLISLHRLPLTWEANMPRKIRAVLVRSCPEHRVTLALTNFSDQSFPARCPESDKHSYRWELAGSTVARLFAILINCYSKRNGSVLRCFSILWHMQARSLPLLYDKNT